MSEYLATFLNQALRTHRVSALWSEVSTLLGCVECGHGCRPQARLADITTATALQK